MFTAPTGGEGTAPLGAGETPKGSYESAVLACVCVVGCFVVCSAGNLRTCAHPETSTTLQPVGF